MLTSCYPTADLPRHVLPDIEHFGMFPSRYERFQVGARTKSLTRSGYDGYIQRIVCVKFRPDIPQRVISHGENGYRMYGEEAALRLHQILFYRESASHTILL